MKRRVFVAALAAVGFAGGFVGTMGLFAGSARAELDRLTLMAPAAPGGGWDSTARQMQSALVKARIVKNVQVVNVTGAGGTVGLAGLVNNSKGDGNQLMVMGLVMTGAVLTNHSPVTLAQVTPIARLTGEYEMIVVPANSPIKDMKGLVAALKKDVGAVSWGGGSAGGTDHILAGLIAKAAGVDPAKVNYIAHSGGGEAMANILGGKVTVGVSGVSEFASQIKAKRLRGLAVSSAKRIDGVDVPTLKESGLDVELSNWRGVVAAPGLSDAQRKDLLAVVDKLAKSKEWKAILKKQDWTDLYMAGDEYAKYLKEQDATVSATLKSIGLVK
jgi:putative tricarboxylic transport membrane protein